MFVWAYVCMCADWHEPPVNPVNQNTRPLNPTNRSNPHTNNLPGLHYAISHRAWVNAVCGTLGAVGLYNVPYWEASVRERESKTKQGLFLFCVCCVLHTYI